MIYASIKDLERIYRPLDEEEKKKASKLLENASERLRAEYDFFGIPVPKDEKALKRLKIITCDMVKRAIAGSNDASFSNVSTTVGDFSESYTFSNPNGDLYITDNEKRMLGLYRGRCMSVKVG